MPPVLVAEETINIGQPTVVEGPAPETHYGAVFEDDGVTGYFYGLDFSREHQKIVDARHIYNVEQVTDREIPSVVQIAWSSDGHKVVLLINKYPHAVIDFALRRSFCRTGFPPSGNQWGESDVSWNDAAVDLFR